MTTEEKLKDLILSRYGTLKDFVPLTGLSYSTVDTILRRGIKKSSVSNIIKICQALGISTDELGNDRIVPVDKNIQNRSYMTEINDIITFTKKNIKEYDDLTIDGQPMSQDEIEMLLDGLDIAIGIIKRNRARGENK